MTGETYAALPFGLQLNNYKDLIDDIAKADISKATLSAWKKKGIIARIAMKFPREQMAYHAAHREMIWKKQPRGAIIPYTNSGEIAAL